MFVLAHPMKDAPDNRLNDYGADPLKETHRSTGQMSSVNLEVLAPSRQKELCQLCGSGTNMLKDLCQVNDSGIGLLNSRDKQIKHNYQYNNTEQTTHTHTQTPR